MADYGVNSPEWKALPWAWAAERLIPNKNYWVTTVSAGGAPASMPVWGVWSDDDCRFMFSASSEESQTASSHQSLYWSSSPRTARA